ncbi:MAG: ATP phosphoribosyltransferase regulatory subunit, partial [Ekhidna sp.]|nr:ATP phosphoribosyltransferase regulatory subunit [Ekhidna sp.]
EKVKENVMALGGNSSKLDEILQLFTIQDRDSLIGSIEKIDPENDGIKEIVTYFETLDQFSERDLKVQLDLSLARGLSYYTGMIYEVKPTTVKMGSICGGGRYDNLTGVFGLNGISGIGISFGLDRIYDVLEEQQLFPANVAQPLDALIVHFNEENLRHGQKLVMQLRAANVKADLYPSVEKIKKQFNYAHKINAPYTIIIGDNEMDTEMYMIKNMHSGEQKPMSANEIIQLFQG